MDTGDEVINEQETHLRAMEGRCEREGDLIGVASCLCSSKPSIIFAKLPAAARLHRGDNTKRQLQQSACKQSSEKQVIKYTKAVTNTVCLGRKRGTFDMHQVTALSKHVAQAMRPIAKAVT